MPPTGDADLLERVRSREVGALRELYDRHGGLVYTLAKSTARNRRVDAQQLTVDAFTELWRMPPPPGEGSARRHLVRLVGRLANGRAVAAAV
jgi:DNA-directed RNA polymerase specialized sigma24 family protein